LYFKATVYFQKQRLKNGTSFVYSSLCKSEFAKQTIWAILNHIQPSETISSRQIDSERNY